MKNLKKIFAITLAVVTIAATMAACGGEEENNKVTGKVTEVVATVISSAETDEDETVVPTSTEAETTAPAVTEAETTAPVTAEPEGNKPEANRPETNKPETNKPAPDKPQSTKPESQKPETNKPETPTPPANSQHYYAMSIDGRWKAGEINVLPCEWYFENGNFILKAYIVNGYSTTATNINVNEIIIKDANGVKFAHERFYNQNLTINSLSYLEHTFVIGSGAMTTTDVDISTLDTSAACSADH